MHCRAKLTQVLCLFICSDLHTQDVFVLLYTAVSQTLAVVAKLHFPMDHGNNAMIISIKLFYIILLLLLLYMRQFMAKN